MEVGTKKLEKPGHLGLIVTGVSLVQKCPDSYMSDFHKKQAGFLGWLL